MFQMIGSAYLVLLRKLSLGSADVIVCSNKMVLLFVVHFHYSIKACR